MSHVSFQKNLAKCSVSSSEALNGHESTRFGLKLEFCAFEATVLLEISAWWSSCRVFGFLFPVVNG